AGRKIQPADYHLAAAVEREIKGTISIFSQCAANTEAAAILQSAADAGCAARENPAQTRRRRRSTGTGLGQYERSQSCLLRGIGPGVEYVPVAGQTGRPGAIRKLPGHLVTLV